MMGSLSRHPSRKRKGDRSETPERLGEVIGQLTGGRPLAEGLILGELGRRWTDVVGDRLAGVCRPVAFHGGILVVRASSAAWATQLRFLSREVSRASNEVLEGDRVKAVKVVVSTSQEARK